MPESLVLRVNTSPDQPHSWMIVDGNGTRIGEVDHGSLDQIGSLAESRVLIALLPATVCLTAYSSLPLKNAQKLRQALPFEFEDQLLDDIGAMHFATGPRDESGKFPVGAIRRETFESILAEFAEHGLSPYQIIPEAMAVPLTPKGCTILLEGTEAIIRSADGNSLLMDHASLAAAIQLAEHGTAKSDSTSDSHIPVTVFIDDSSGTSGEQSIADLHSRYPDTEFRRLPHGALSKLAVNAIRPGHPNMLQGDYAPSTSFEKLAEPWRYAAVAAAVFLAVTIGYKAVEFTSMKQRYAQLNSTMLELAKNTFPQRQQITNPVGLFRQQAKATQVSGASGDSEFILMLEVLSQAASDNSGLSVSRLNYRPGNLDLELTAPNVQILDSLTNTITGQENWSASLQSTKPDGDSVVGRITIQGKQP